MARLPTQWDLGKEISAYEPAYQQWRDSQICLCGHKCISHGSYTNSGEFVSIGGGMCGIENCNCGQLTISENGA